MAYSLLARLSSLRTIPPSPLLSRGAALFCISLPTTVHVPLSRRFLPLSTTMFGCTTNMSVVRNTTSAALREEAEFVSVERSMQNDWVGYLLSSLHNCWDASFLSVGRQVHAQLLANGMWGDSLYGTRLLSMYVLCRSIVDAKNIFLELDRRYTLPWNWMIRGFTMINCYEFALSLYFKMLANHVSPDRYTFPHVIKACNRLSAVKGGRLIHQSVQLMGLETDSIIGSSLMKMYADNGCFAEALEVFDIIPERDTVLWNVMIHAYATNKDVEQALELFNQMRTSETQPNSVSFASVLSVCAWGGVVGCGTQLHGLLFKYGFDLESSVANTLLAMYSKCRCLDDSRKLFDTRPHTDLVAWNGMISGFVQSGCIKEALEVFFEMQSAGVKPDSITLASFLPAVADLSSLEHGKQIHGYIVRQELFMDAFLKSALIDVYFKCRAVDLAIKVFHNTTDLDVVICSSVISGYVLNGMNWDALQLFRQVLRGHIKPNPVMLASILPSCAPLLALKLGQELHCYTIKNEIDRRHYVGSALMDMYAKCGRLDLSHCVFMSIKERDSILWNTMIVNLSQNGNPEDAIWIFRQMGLSGVNPDCVTISAALSACANIPKLLYGKEVHGYIIKGLFMSDIFVLSTLIDLYAKCGCLTSACQIFDLMKEKNEVSYNSMIAAYGSHGLVDDAISFFNEMVISGIEPDHITFLSIISACGHAGRVDEGFKFFQLMTDNYGIIAKMEHYACVIDLFGRSGRLDEAFKVINDMPFKPDAGIWGSLLGASKVHGNVKLAELASRQLLELDPENSGYYVLMSNMHAIANRWDGVSKLRNLMKDRGVQKIPGYSWIELNNATHMFVAADRDHTSSGEVYLLLDHLYLELREEGYVPNTGFCGQPST